MTLPNLPDLVSGTTTEGDFQGAMTTLYNHIAETIGAEDPEDVGIVLGDVTPTRALVKLDTENSSPTDDLDHIVATNLSQRLIMLQITDGSRTVVLKHNIAGSGKLLLLDDVDVELSDTKQFVLLRHNSSDDSWYELDRNFGFLAPTATIKAALRAKLGILDIATLAVGTASGQVPTADLLGALAFMTTIGTDQIVDDAITGAKILAGSVNLSKIANGTPGYYMGFNDTTGVAEEKPLGITAPPAPELFENSGTWSKPVGWVGKCRITVVGGGGGGGGVGTSTSPGSTGGTSSFGAHCSASGGVGGGSVYFAATMYPGYGGVGGVGSGGDINFYGNGGASGGVGAHSDSQVGTKAAHGGAGGGSFFGGGARGRQVGDQTSQNGISAQTYGGGGGGACNTTSTTRNGGSSGGGGGGCAIKHMDASELGATETITIGNGGAGRSTDSSGGAGAKGVILVEYY